MDKITIKSRIPWRDIAGQVVIVDPKSSRVHELNDSASMIWKCLDKKMTQSEIVSQLTQHYEIDSRTALFDLMETLATLQALDLLITH